MSKLSIFNRAKEWLREAVIRSVSEDRMIVEMARRDGRPSEKSFGIVPELHYERAAKLEEWRWAINARLNPPFFNPAPLMGIYQDAYKDLHLLAVLETRLKKVAATKFKLVDAQGQEDPTAWGMFQGQWFTDFILHSMESLFWGTTLLDLTRQSTEPVTVKANSGTKTYYPLLGISVVSRKHVRPVQQVVVKTVNDDPSRGTTYIEPPTDLYYLPVGRVEDLGLLRYIAPYVMAKRYALAAWGEFVEKLGIPFRSVKMQGQNKEREKMLAQIMQNMGSAGWAILHPGEEIEYLETAKTDPHKCFLELLEYLNKEISKAVLGQTMTTEDGASLSQAKVHKQVANDRHEADIAFILALINDELLPRLIEMGYPLQGYRVDRNTKEEVSITEQIKIDGVLLQYFDLDPELYLSERYGIPVEAFKKKEVTKPINPNDPGGDNGNPPPDDPTDPDNEPENALGYGLGKPNPAAKPTPKQQGNGDARTNTHPTILMLAEARHSLMAGLSLAEGEGCSHIEHRPSNIVTEAPALPDDFLTAFFNAPASRDRAYLPQITEHTQSLLNGALNTEFPAKSVDSGFRSFDQNLRLHFQSSIHRFAFAKSVAEVLALNELAKSATTKADFLKAAKQLNSTWNVNYLTTEFNTAKAKAQNAAAATQAVQTGHTHWSWLAIIDALTRPLHVAYNGKTFSIAKGYDSDSFKAIPPTEPNCRCKPRFFTPTDKQLSSLQVEDPEAFLAAIPNRAKMEEYGLLENPFQTKDLVSKGLSYLKDLPGGEALVANKLTTLTPELQGIKPLAEVYKEKLPLKPTYTPEEARTKATEDFYDRLDKAGAENAAAPFQDYQGDTLWLPLAQFNRQQSRADAYLELAKILQKPDEVYFNPAADAADGQPTGGIYTYIRHYQGQSVYATFSLIDELQSAITFYGTRLASAGRATDLGILTYASKVAKAN
jgi:SPP1 gp7 family putative phage head morphogenesis protein